MRIFLFEFASCGKRVADLSDGIVAEGLAMFFSMYSGFSRFAEVDTFIGDYIDGREIGGDLVRHDVLERRIKFESAEEMKETMERKIDESDYFLIIAPEDDFLLYELTKLGEKCGENLGSSSEAVKVTSDKWELYRRLKGKVNVPRTSMKPLDCSFVLKPRVSCGGEGIRLCEAVDVPEGYIAQEYVEGTAVSLSFSVIEGDVKLLSVNEQILNNFTYTGSIVPARLNESVVDELVEEAARAVESIRGLRGYVGVDMVYSDEPYVIEVNSRPTTSSVAFEFAYGSNVVEMTYEDLFGINARRERRGTFELRKCRRCDGKTLVRIGDVSVMIREL